MAKYSYDLKKQIVKEYLCGEGGYEYLANKYGIPDKKIIRLWVNNYKAFGDDGLMRSRQQKIILFKRNFLL